MTLHQDRPQTDRRASESSSLAGSVNTYNLENTLEAYEVEELDGHDLARFLPAMTAPETTGIN
jgi:hypothetical protein